MPPRSALPGLSFALALSLAGGATWAQQINRGPMAVVGLRAPDGDVDAATALSTGLREAARQAGYQVPADTPSFDQEFAMVGCSSTSPECLSLIAGDVHASKYIYGTVQRIGRGRDAQLSVEVSLWDDTSHREIHREAATIPRAQVRPETLRELAQRMFVAIGNRDMAAQQDVIRVQQEEAARLARQQEAERQAREQEERLRQAQQQLRRGTVIQRSHVLRYVGLGVLGLGVVAGGVGVWQAIVTNGHASDSLNGQGEEGAAWARYDNAVNANRRMSVSDVCTSAANNRDASLAADAALARNLCDQNSTSTALAYAFGIGGVVIAGVGAALIIIDSLGSSSSATTEGQPPAGAAAQPRARLQVSPIISDRVGGVNLGLTF